jgi:hypothetical protein
VSLHSTLWLRSESTRLVSSSISFDYSLSKLYRKKLSGTAHAHCLAGQRNGELSRAELETPVGVGAANTRWEFGLPPVMAPCWVDSFSVIGTLVAEMELVQCESGQVGLARLLHGTRCRSCDAHRSRYHQTYTTPQTGTEHTSKLMTEVVPIMLD